MARASRSTCKTFEQYKMSRPTGQCVSKLQLRRLSRRLIFCGPMLGWGASTVLLSTFANSFFYPKTDGSGPDTLFLPQIAIVFGLPLGLLIGVFTALARKIIAPRLSSVIKVKTTTISAAGVFGIVFYILFWAWPSARIDLWLFTPCAGLVVAAGAWFICWVTFRVPKPPKPVDPGEDWWR